MHTANGISACKLKRKEQMVTERVYVLICFLVINCNYFNDAFYLVVLHPTVFIANEANVFVGGVRVG